MAVSHRYSYLCKSKKHRQIRGVLLAGVLFLPVCGVLGFNHFSSLAAFISSFAILGVRPVQFALNKLDVTNRRGTRILRQFQLGAVATGIVAGVVGEIKLPLPPPDRQPSVETPDRFPTSASFRNNRLNARLG